METLADVGELELVRRVSELVRDAGGPPSPGGPGDDAAVLAGGTVVTTDLLVEGVHFRRDWSSAADIGTKAAAANLADVSAMGARPTSLLVALGAPGETPVAWLEELTEGFLLEAGAAGAHLVGGDISSAPVVVLGITAVGRLSGAPVTRSGARVGDLVVVAGALGRSAAGLRRLAAGDRSGELVEAHRRPTPPYSLGLALSRLGATSMIDSSDGPGTDLAHLCRSSGVGMELGREGLASFATDGVTLHDVLTGGEDHSLLATLPPLTVLPDGVRIIGRVVEGDRVLLDGEEVAPAWEHHRGS